MKTTIKIELITDKMNKVLDEDDKDITKKIEERIHKLFIEVNNEELIYDVLENEVLSDKETKIDGTESMDDYGMINISVVKM